MKTRKQRFIRWIKGHPDSMDRIYEAAEELGMSREAVQDLIKRLCHVLETAPESKYNYRVWTKFINASIRNEAAQHRPAQRSRPSEFKEGRIVGI